MQHFAYHNTSECGSHALLQPNAHDSERDVRLDFVRGGAFLSIFLNHTPGNIFSRLTYGYFGFSDAAEVFVLLAGLSLGLSRGIYSNGFEFCIKRVIILYVASSALLICSSIIYLAACYVWPKEVAEFYRVNFEVRLPASWEELGQGLVLFRQPEFFDIIPLYIMLFMWLPVLVYICRKNAVVALACSFAIWFCANYFSINLLGMRSGGWYFNPFAWQLLFSIGVLWGNRVRGVGTLEKKSDSTAVTSAAGIYILFCFFVSAPWTHYPALSIGGIGLSSAELIGPTGKTYLSVWRLTHILCVAYVASQIVGRDARWLQSRLAQRIVLLGRQSVRAFFCVSIVSLVCSILILLTERHAAGHFLINCLGVGLIFLGVNVRLNVSASRSTSNPDHAPGRSVGGMM
jgi:hypothetical protein